MKIQEKAFDRITKNDFLEREKIRNSQKKNDQRKQNLKTFVENIISDEEVH